MTKAQQRIDELKERESNLTNALSNLRSVPNNITLEKIRLQKLIDENKSAYDKIANKLKIDCQSSIRGKSPSTNTRTAIAKAASFGALLINRVTEVGAPW